MGVERVPQKRCNETSPRVQVLCREKMYTYEAVPAEPRASSRSCVAQFKSSSIS